MTHSTGIQGSGRCIVVHTISAYVGIRLSEGRREDSEDAYSRRFRENEAVVRLTTGHRLKDSDAAAEAGGDPEPVPNDTDAVLKYLDD